MNTGRPSNDQILSLVGFAAVAGVLIYLLYFGGKENVGDVDAVKIKTLIALSILLLMFGALLIWRLDQRSANLAFIICDTTGKPSMARFQAMVFTFVVGIGIISLMGKLNNFPDIPNNILILLGGSGVTYLISKNIDAGSSSSSNSNQPDATPASPRPPSPTTFSGAAEPLSLFLGVNPNTAIPAFGDPVVAQAAMAQQPANPQRKIVLTAGVGDYGGWQVVAMLAGRATLTVTCDDQTLTGEVRYPDRGGNSRLAAMQGGTIVINDLATDRIAPVEVHLKGASQAGPATVTVAMTT